MPATAAGRGEPFRTVEEAWFWTMAALAARHDGARFSSHSTRVARPCDPDDVIRCLDQLYRQRRIDLDQARVLRSWGERGSAPDASHPSEQGDWRLWSTALSRLEWPLRMKGILA